MMTQVHSVTWRSIVNWLAECMFDTEIFSFLEISVNQVQLDLAVLDWQQGSCRRFKGVHVKDSGCKILWLLQLILVKSD